MVEMLKSACPHDCPSACVLEVERLSPQRIGRVRGGKHFNYTDGAVCAKVARYAERIHHPDRLTHPLRRIGAKGSGKFEPMTWDDALDEIATAFIASARQHGRESVWPYHSGGTMGIVQRWGLDRLRHVMGYSGEKTTICIGAAEPGWRAGVGRLEGTESSRDSGLGPGRCLGRKPGVHPSEPHASYPTGAQGPGSEAHGGRLLSHPNGRKG